MLKENTLLRMDNVPKSIMEWVGILYPGPAGEEWLRDSNDVFDGKSPLEMLSVPHDENEGQLRENVERLVRAFHEVLAIMSMPRPASDEEVYEETVRAQERAKVKNQLTGAVAKCLISGMDKTEVAKIVSDTIEDITVQSRCASV